MPLIWHIFLLKGMKLKTTIMKLLLKKVTLICLALFVLGCNENKTGTTDSADTTSTNHVTADSAIAQRNNEEQERREFRITINHELDSLDRKIERLEERIKTQKGETKTRSIERRDRLKARSQELRRQLDAAEDSTKQDWQGFKSTVRKEVDDFRNSVDRFFEEDKEVEIEVKNKNNKK